MVIPDLERRLTELDRVKLISIVPDFQYPNCLRTSRAITRRWISEVPLPIVHSLQQVQSRHSRMILVNSAAPSGMSSSGKS